nr:MAG TPA: hypothetical protein [Caudoviricetes sp.]
MRRINQQEVSSNGVHFNQLFRVLARRPVRHDRRGTGIQYGRTKRKNQ